LRIIPKIEKQLRKVFSACQRRSDDETDPSHSFQQLKNYPSKKKVAITILAGTN
jgi:hypothetical protein